LCLRRQATAASSGSNDPYDNYSATSRAESIEQQQRRTSCCYVVCSYTHAHTYTHAHAHSLCCVTIHSHRPSVLSRAYVPPPLRSEAAQRTQPAKKKPAGSAPRAAPATDANPFDEAQPEENPFDQDEQAAAKPKKKVVKAKPKPQPVEDDEQPPEEEEAPPAVVPKIAKPKAAARTRTKNSMTPEDNAFAAQPAPATRRNNVDDLLAGIAGSGNYGGQAASGDFDFLTGQMDNMTVQHGSGGGGGFADEGTRACLSVCACLCVCSVYDWLNCARQIGCVDAGGDGGHAGWAPENEEDDDSADQV